MANIPFEDLSGFHIVNMQEHSVLHEKRQILGLTQQAVADRAKIPLQSYQSFESGKRKLRTASFRIACAVLEALEMDIADFYHGDYVIGEEVVNSKEGLRYKKTGKLINDEPEG